MTWHIDTVYDNGGRTFDRYTAFLSDGEEGYALGIGDTGNVPNGFCMHVDAVRGAHLGRVILLEEMTEPARRALLAEVEWAERESKVAR